MRAPYMSKILILVVVALMAVGCGGSRDVDDSEKVEGGVTGINVIHVDVDGRRVPCIHSWGHESRALSCDWSAQ